MAAAIAAMILAARPALAVEREHHVGVDLGATMFSVSEKGSVDLGPMAGAHYAYGLTDAFNLMVEGSWSLLSTSEPGGKTVPHTRPTWEAHGSAGVAYVFDVLTWVPYVGILVGGYVLGGGTLDNAKPLAGFSLAVGADYRLSRSLSVGISARQHMMSDPSTYPEFTQLFAQAEYTFGW
jgi:hypothetical protein